MKKMKKWKKNEKKKRCLLECLSQKRVIYIQVNWEWNIRSNTGAIRYPCLYSHISHHTYQLRQSDFQYLCLSSYNTRTIWFNMYPCYPIFVTLPRQVIFHKISSFPLYIQTRATCINCLPFRTNRLDYPYFLSKA